MNRPPHTERAPLPEPTIKLAEGWHCLHIYYQVNQFAIDQLSDEDRAHGREELANILDPSRDGAPERIQTMVTSGHDADLGLMILDPDPLVVNSIKTAVRSSLLGFALEPVYSFVSITEISEYVPTIEQYSAKLKLEGTDPESPAFSAKLKAYEQRLPVMNQQRLYPNFPELPVHCFYPMNKSRVPGANWFMVPFSERARLMSEHATSGIKFAGLVSQLITASTGFDDWEWGVTLWGRAPGNIKDIVYKMRFDEASAKYAEFGPFYISYVLPPVEAFEQIML